MDSTCLYVILIITLATLIRSTFGFGEALVAVPLLALRIPVIVAVPLAVLVSVVVAAVIVAQDWRNLHLKSAAGLVVSALAGLPFGLLLILRGNEQLVKLTLGAIIVSFSIYSLTGKGRLHLQKDHPLWLLGCGFCSGVLGGAYGMNGPPLAIYGAMRRWSPQHFRATLQGYFLVLSLAAMIGYTAAGLWVPAITRYFLWSLPPVLLAIVAGRMLNHRLPAARFFRYVYAGLIVIGLILIVQSR